MPGIGDTQAEIGKCLYRFNAMNVDWDLLDSKCASGTHCAKPAVPSPPPPDGTTTQADCMANGG